MVDILSIVIIALILVQGGITIILLYGVNARILEVGQIVNKTVGDNMIELAEKAEALAGGVDDPLTRIKGIIQLFQEMSSGNKGDGGSELVDVKVIDSIRDEKGRFGA
jgi:hypothetical protein